MKIQEDIVTGIGGRTRPMVQHHYDIRHALLRKTCQTLLP